MKRNNIGPPTSLLVLVRISSFLVVGCPPFDGTMLEELCVFGRRNDGTTLTLNNSCISHGLHSYHSQLSKTFFVGRVLGGGDDLFQRRYEARVRSCCFGTPRLHS